MKTITIEIPEGKRAEWVDGVLTLVDEQPQDITKRIKTFVDAEMWCRRNGQEHLVNQYYRIVDALHLCPSKEWSDLLAYLKLRIITCALNEGWEPAFKDVVWGVYYNTDTKKIYTDPENITICMQRSLALVYKSNRLAQYAATKFRDIYMDFCHKGKR